jgi:L-ascorbate metabolism protein UlaG (beta-lactamase superfamily)
MRPISATLPLVMALFSATLFAQGNLETDTISTSRGDLRITFIGHGTLMFEFDGKVIHVDPAARYADYSALPKADLVLVTHEHGDHFDPKTIDRISRPDTRLVLSPACADRAKRGLVMKNGDKTSIAGITIEAVPAYNLVHERKPGQPFHPKGVGNGYVLTLGKTRVYVAGDTENIPEMARLTGVDCAFLPMNLPYTMTPEMVADAVGKLKPKIVYPYHYGETDTSRLVKLLKDVKDTEVRIRKMK